MKKIQGYLFAVVCISLALSGCSGTRGDDSSLSDDLSLQPVFPFDEPIVVGEPETNPADAPDENVAAIWTPFSAEPGHPGLPLKLTHAESGGSFSPETVDLL